MHSPAGFIWFSPDKSRIFFLKLQSHTTFNPYAEVPWSETGMKSSETGHEDIRSLSILNFVEQRGFLMKKEKLYAAMLAASMILPYSQRLYADEQNDGLQTYGASFSEETGSSQGGGIPQGTGTSDGDSVPQGTGTSDAGGVPQGRGTSDAGSVPQGTGTSHGGSVPQGTASDASPQTTTDPADQPEIPGKPAVPTVQEIAQYGYKLVTADEDGSDSEADTPLDLSPDYLSLGEMFREGSVWVIRGEVNGTALAESLGKDLTDSLPGYYVYDPETEQWSPANLPVLTLKDKTEVPIPPEAPQPEKKPAPTVAPTPEELGLFHYAMVTGPGIGLGDIKPGTVTVSNPQINDQGETYVTASIDASQYPFDSRLPSKESATMVTFIWNGSAWEYQSGAFQLVYNLQEPGTLKPSAPGKLPTLAEMYLTHVTIMDPVNNSAESVEIIPGSVTLSEIQSTSDGIAYVTATLDSELYKNAAGQLPSPALSTTQVQIIWNGYSWRRTGSFYLRYPYTVSAAPDTKPAPESLSLHMTIQKGDDSVHTLAEPDNVSVSDIKTNGDGMYYVTVTLDTSKYEMDSMLPSPVLSRTALDYYWTGNDWFPVGGEFLLVFPLEGAGQPDSGEGNKPGSGEGNKPGSGEENKPETGDKNEPENENQTGSGNGKQPVKGNNKPVRTDKTGSTSSVPTGVLSMTGLWGATAAVSAAVAAWLRKKH